MPRKPRRILKQDIPAEDIQFERVFIRGEVGYGTRLISELQKHGGRNITGLGGNNPYRIYYIGDEGIIRYVEVNTPGSYLLEHSDWEELIIKKKI